MIKKIDNLLEKTFLFVFFLTPLVFLPITSELFEFNKLILVYIGTTLISAFWIAKMVVAKKIIFRRTILDIPLLIFLLSQIVSTFLSIDGRTSLLGYYSRFHGGLASSFSYTVLYWAWVANMRKGQVKKAYKTLIFSSIIVSIYAVLQKLGIDKNIWVQDVQNRVFSSLGQPNWLASFVLIILPISWAQIMGRSLTLSKINLKDKRIWYLISGVFFLVLLFTKSRSGFLGFFAESFLFSFLVFKKYKESLVKKFLPLGIIFLFLAIIFGTPWSPAIAEVKKGAGKKEEKASTLPLLETGGTESGEIRKIVWKGAFDIWKKSPLFGTGVETFAFSYYLYRPVEHNLVSEWDFIYNKAHNEYLNFAATTGTFGLVSYLALIGFVSFYFYNKVWLEKAPLWENLGLSSAFASLLVVNFFGFSVVVTGLAFFLIPAFSISWEGPPKERLPSTNKLNQKVYLGLIFLLALFLLNFLIRYWYADTLFAKGKLLSNQGDPVSAQNYFARAVKISPQESIFWQELADSYAEIAVSLSLNSEAKEAEAFSKEAIKDSEIALNLSSKNPNLKRNAASMYIKLALVDPNYLFAAEELLSQAIKLAPTDAKLFYNLGLTQARLGKSDPALQTLQKAVSLKENYRNARLALGILFAEGGEKEKAKEQFNYILENIDPNDELTKSQLEEVR